MYKMYKMLTHDCIQCISDSIYMDWNTLLPRIDDQNTGSSLLPFTITNHAIFVILKVAHLNMD